MCTERFTFYAQNGESSAFARKKTPLFTRFLDSMQCFRFNKKHNVLLDTSNFRLQLQFKCFRTFNNVNQHNVPSRKVIKTWYQKFRTDNSTCDSGRLPPPDADRERVRPAFHNSPTLSVRRQYLCTQFTNRQEKK
jgi:hypothetical protein